MTHLRFVRATSWCRRRPASSARTCSLFLSDDGSRERPRTGAGSLSSSELVTDESWPSLPSDSSSSSSSVVPSFSSSFLSLPPPLEPGWFLFFDVLRVSMIVSFFFRDAARNLRTCSFSTASAPCFFSASIVLMDTSESEWRCSAKSSSLRFSSALNPVISFDLAKELASISWSLWIRLSLSLKICSEFSCELALCFASSLIKDSDWNSKFFMAKSFRSQALFSFLHLAAK